MRKCNYLSEWEAINLKNLLHDAQLMDTGNLARRYQISHSTVIAYLTKNGVKPKFPYGHTTSHSTTGNALMSLDEPYVDVRPRNWL